jgi:hypothetical protein
MHDNAFATKRFTRNAAQQAVKQILYHLSDFWKQNTHCNAAKRLEKAIKQPLCLSSAADFTQQHSGDHARSQDRIALASGLTDASR